MLHFIPPARHRFHDGQTGCEIWQLSEGDATSFAPYMYRRGFSHDERYVIYSSNRTGVWEVFRVEIETGETAQLTQNVGYDIQHVALTMNPAGREAFLIAGLTIRAVDVQTGQEHVVLNYAHLTGGRLAHSFSLTEDGERLLIHYPRKGDGRTAIALGSALGTENKAEEIYVFGADTQRITHTLFCPTDPDVLTYNRQPDRQNDFDASPEARARCWKLNLRTGEDVPFLVMPPGFRATHEYWSPEGTRLFFHRKHVPDWVPAAIGSISAEGGEPTIHYETDTIKLGHSSLNAAMTHLVSDSQEAGRNQLLLIDLADAEAQTLCWPNASGAPHPNHVHPSFSPSGRFVLYTSDASSRAQVYLLPLTIC